MGDSAGLLSIQVLHGVRSQVEVPQSSIDPSELFKQPETKVYASHLFLHIYQNMVTIVYSRPPSYTHPPPRITHSFLLLDDIPISQVRPRRRRNLVHNPPPVPNRRPPLHDRDDLARQPVRELVAPAPHGRLLGDGVEDPLEGNAPPLAHLERDGQLERLASARRAAEVADAHQGRDRVDGEGEVDDWVEWEVVGRGRAGEEGVFGAKDGRRGGAEDVENASEVLPIVRYKYISRDTAKGGVCAKVKKPGVSKRTLCALLSFPSLMRSLDICARTG